MFLKKLTISSSPSSYFSFNYFMSKYSLAPSDIKDRKLIKTDISYSLNK